MGVSVILSAVESSVDFESGKGILDKVRSFRAKRRVQHECDDFLVRTAENSGDLLRVLELRHEIFIKEWQGRSLDLGLDVDEFDFVADHLMIIDKRKEMVIGTYRVLDSQYTQNFYSQNEFHMDAFMLWPSRKLELGRACIHSSYRNGNSIDLLWKGLARYIVAAGVRYLFGCASVKETDPSAVASLLLHLRDKSQLSDEYRIRPRAKYTFPSFQIEEGRQMSPNEIRKMTPPLLRSYLHAGARVFGLPAFDKEFSCVDLLTVLDVTRLNKKFQQRYFDC